MYHNPLVVDCNLAPPVLAGEAPQPGCGCADCPRACTLNLPEFQAVLRIRIRIPRIHMFLGLSDPDPLVRGMDPDPDPALDPDPSIIMQK
jgi:hypothetical protein